MSFTPNFIETEPSRAEIDSIQEALVLEFGAPWCSYCRAAQPAIEQALGNAGVQHLKVEDGKGRPLGRSFRVKLWPTLVFLKQGKEMARLVRPDDANAIEQAVKMLADPDGAPTG